MGTILLGILGLGLAGAEPEAGERSPKPQAATVEAAIGIPWNPDLRHANAWPYPAPVQIPSDYCGPPGEFWLRAEYYLWDLKTTAIPDFIAPDLAPYSGGRFTAGAWFDNCYTLGFEGTYFFLAERGVRVGSGSWAGPVPAFLAVGAATELLGAEATAVWNVCRTKTWVLDLLGGFRYLDLGEDAIITAGSLPLGETATFSVDQFGVRNHFYGGQVGARVTHCWRSLTVSLIEKLAFGAIVVKTGVDGGTAELTPAGRLRRMSGGPRTPIDILGRRSEDAFAVVNEVGVQLGWQVCDYVQLFVGYSFLFDSSVVRVGDLMSRLPGSALTPPDSDFWAHGLNLGLELRY